MADPAETTKIILVRHGECEGNVEGLFRGRSDFPLNKNGVRQAQSLAEEIANLERVDFIFTSPLKRAAETAQIISQRMGNIPVTALQGFTNISLGPWEGRKKKEIMQEYPEEWSLWIKSPERLKLPNAESISDVQKRAFSTLEFLVQKHREKTLLIVSHRAVLKPLIAACIQISDPYFWRIHVDTASYSIIVHDEARGYCLTLLNQTKHLENFTSEWV